MDSKRIDEAVLGLLWLGRHQTRQLEATRAWKSFDWDAMERLHQSGFIANPIGKAKSVAFTKEGLLQAEAAYQRLFEDRSRPV